MKKLGFCALALTLALSSQSTYASFINSDLNPGDGLTVTDTLTGNVWLDLTQTAGLSIATVSSQLTTTYAGWRLATSDEVLDMFQRLFPAFNLTTDYYYNSSVLPSLFTTCTGLFGITQPGSTNWSMGLFLHDGMVKRSGMHQSTPTRLTNFLGISTDLNAGGSSDGVFLIQSLNSSTPPNDVAVSALGGMGLGAFMLLLGLRSRRMRR